MMGKKQFQAIARVVYDVTAGRCRLCDARAVILSGDVFGCPVHGIQQLHYLGGVEMGALLIDELTQTLAQENPRFDSDRFREACETGKTKGMPR